MQQKQVEAQKNYMTMKEYQIFSKKFRLLFSGISKKISEKKF